MLADQLRQSSDDLTRMARTYVITGNKKFKEHFHEILAIRDGMGLRPREYRNIYWDLITDTGSRPTSFGPPMALVDLMKLIGLSTQELAKLAEAKTNSDSLARLEITAFAAMNGLFENETGELTVARVPNPNFARHILHSDEYHKAKSSIMRPIKDFKELIDQRTLREVKALQTKEAFYRNVAITLVMLTILLSIIVHYDLRRRIIDPVISLTEIAQLVEKGDIDARAFTVTSDEIGTLNNAFNSMVNQTQEAIVDLRNERDFSSSTIDSLPGVFYMFTYDGQFKKWNKNFETVTGRSPEELANLHPLDLFPENDKQRWNDKIKQVFREGYADLEASIITKSNISIPYFFTGQRYTSGGHQLLLGMGIDISDRVQAEEKIRLLAMSDPLTGLANRTQFDQRLTRSIKLANRERKILALMMVDLDDFKLVNDTFGHPSGDALLKTVSSIFNKLTRETDVVSRFGGDEFAILVVHPESEKNAEMNAQRIIDEIKKSITIMGSEIHIGASIGIAIYPKDADDKKGLIRKADLALYEAKESGRGILTFYRPEMDSDG